MEGGGGSGEGKGGDCCRATGLVVPYDRLPLCTVQVLYLWQVVRRPPCSHAHIQVTKPN